MRGHLQLNDQENINPLQPSPSISSTNKGSSQKLSPLMSSTSNIIPLQPSLTMSSTSKIVSQCPSPILSSISRNIPRQPTMSSAQSNIEPRITRSMTLSSISVPGESRPIRRVFLSRSPLTERRTDQYLDSPLLMTSLHSSSPKKNPTSN